MIGPLPNVVLTSTHFGPKIPRFTSVLATSMEADEKRKEENESSVFRIEVSKEKIQTWETELRCRRLAKLLKALGELPV